MYLRFSRTKPGHPWNGLGAGHGEPVYYLVVVVAIATMVMADVMMMGIIIGSDNTSSFDSNRSNKVIASKAGRRKQ